MKNVVTFMIWLLLCVSGKAQVGDSVSVTNDMVSDVCKLWNAIPDSILPLKHRANIDVANDRSLTAKLTDVMEVQMRTLAADSGNKIVCLVKTFAAPEKESTVSLYDNNWNLLEELKFRLSDILSDTEAMKYAVFFEPELISVSLSEDQDSLVLSANLQKLSDEDKTELKDVVLQRTLNWNGKTFK